MGAKKKKRTYQSPVRQAERAATHQRIVAAATSMLGEVGFHQFSLDAVAKRAGVSRLTVYNQFGERRSLLEAVFDAQAASAGLADLAAAMKMQDPRAALTRVVQVFCNFWANGGAIRGVIAAAMSDPELEQALRARNARRRHLLEVIVGRMARGAGASLRAERLVDTLFALTSFPFFAELSNAKMSVAEIADTIAELAASAVDRCSCASSR